ncbi:MAG: hypothetical protein HRT92_04595 [Piscirickettsiaceae bacterium]|nr:hypothetical protein [Piscirickettsiaceae bacterium]
METENKCAAYPHEFLMTNLSVFHLLVPFVALSSNYTTIILVISFGASILSLLWIVKKARITCCTSSKDSPLIKAHWQQAWKRSKLLLIGYAISVGVLLVGWFIASSQADPNMFDILLAVFSWLAVIPLVFIVFGLFVLSTASSTRAKQGQFPRKSAFSLGSETE